MNRRSFLKMFGSASVVAVAPSYFFAPKGGWRPQASYNVSFVSGLPPQEVMRVYYEKSFLDTLKEQFVLTGTGIVIALPETYGRIIALENKFLPVNGRSGLATFPRPIIRQLNLADLPLL